MNTFRMRFSERDAGFLMSFGEVHTMPDAESFVSGREVGYAEGYASGKQDEDAIIRRNIKRYSNDRIVAVGGQAFYGCDSLVEVSFSKVQSISSNGFRNCSSLEKADFEQLETINANVFSGCSALKALIIRTDTLCRLANVSAFANSSIASGTGYIYVPASLVDAYKAAANWQTYASQIRAIEDYPEITGG